MSFPTILLLLSVLTSAASALQQGAGSQAVSAAAAANDGRLRFRADGTFRILQITDLHYGENATLDGLSDQIQAQMLAAERPDLVVFSGDMVSGWMCKAGSPSPPGGATCGPGWFAGLWEQLTAPVKAAGVPWAVTLGNHDAEAELDRRQILDLAIRTGGLFSLTRQGPAAATGASNYWIDIWPALPAAAGTDDIGEGRLQAAGQRGAAMQPERQQLEQQTGGSEDSRTGDAGGPVARVWLLDSMDRTCPPLMFGWGCVAGDTLAWLNDTAHRLPPVPTSLAFVHIPVSQFVDVWFDQPTVGQKMEDVACSVRDTGLFGLARSLGISAVYSGHDHNNDFVGALDGVRLAYGRKSGYGGYGPPPGWLRGSRAIQLRLGQDAAHSETWIRLEDGTKIQQHSSAQAKDLRQLICHCDEFEAQPELRERALQLARQEADAQLAGASVGLEAAAAATALEAD